MSSALSKNTQANAGSTAPSVSAADSASSAIAVAASGTTNGHDASAANATGNGTGSPTANPTTNPTANATGNPTGDSGHASYAGCATTNATWNALGCSLFYANRYGHAADGYVHDPRKYVGVPEWEFKLAHQYVNRCLIVYLWRPFQSFSIWYPECGMREGVIFVQFSGLWSRQTRAIHLIHHNKSKHCNICMEKSGLWSLQPVFACLSSDIIVIFTGGLWPAVPFRTVQRQCKRVWRRCLSKFLYNLEISDILESPWMFSLHPFVLNVCHARTARQGPQGAQGTQGANGASQLMPWKDQAVENARQGPPMGTAHRFHQHLGRKKSQKFQSCLLQETRCQQISTQILSIGQVRTRQRHMRVVFCSIGSMNTMSERKSLLHTWALATPWVADTTALARRCEGTWDVALFIQLFARSGRTPTWECSHLMPASSRRSTTRATCPLLNQRAGVAQGGRNC